jgi:hypothetical protein
MELNSCTSARASSAGLDLGSASEKMFMHRKNICTEVCHGKMQKEATQQE